MRASELHRAVARATGESLSAIRRRGFSLLGVEPDDGDSFAEQGVGPIDWDALDAERARLPLVGSLSAS
jgi:hypothetical protein